MISGAYIYIITPYYRLKGCEKIPPATGEQMAPKLEFGLTRVINVAFVIPPAVQCLKSGGYLSFATEVLSALSAQRVSSSGQPGKNICARKCSPHSENKRSFSCSCIEFKKEA